MKSSKLFCDLAPVGETDHQAICKPVPSSALPVAAILAVMVGVSVVQACNIPVFRYALERWKPDSCEVVVFHNGDLSDRESSVIKEFQASSSELSGHSNAKVVVVNVSTSSDAGRMQLWNELKESQDVETNGEMPRVLVRTKLGKGRFVNHWQGTLEKATEHGIFHSPVRSQIRTRLLAGHSVVWLMIGSGDPQKDQAARKMAEDTFSTLAAKIQLPEGIGLPGSELYADVPLVLKFSLLEIERNDPSEEFLVQLFAGLRREAFDSGEPLLVPVFGRGRALEVIPARDLTPRLMQELTVFLSGACSCQVKEQNPGFDLLIDADWDGELFGDIDNRPPDRTEQEGQNRQPVLVPIPSGRK